MHRLLRRRAVLICVVLALSLGLVGCITTKNSKHKRQDRREVQYNTDQKVGKPQSFSIYKKSRVDKRLLKRGQKQMTSRALDSY